MAKRKIPYHVPEDVDDPKILKRCVLGTLSGDLSFHFQFKYALMNAGFKVWAVLKHETRDLWDVELERGRGMDLDTRAHVRQRICYALYAEDPHADFERMKLKFTGDRFVATFPYKFGAPGVIDSTPLDCQMLKRHSRYFPLPGKRYEKVTVSRRGVPKVQTRIVLGYSDGFLVYQPGRRLHKVSPQGWAKWVVKARLCETPQPLDFADRFGWRTAIVNGKLWK
jgi:hypothetical protein